MTRRAAAFLAVVLLAACSGGGSSGKRSIAQVLGVAHRVPEPFAIFDEARVEVGKSALRVLVADTETERQQGLGSLSNLPRYDGMLFVFPAPTTVQFTMSDTLIPLDIGFYGADGRPIGHAHMEPCAGPKATATGSDCLHAAPGPFRHALETVDALPHGRLSG